MNKPYEDCCISGPFTLGGQSDRQVINARTPESRNLRISYPKFLVERNLGCCILPTVSVDHVDGDYFNNDPDNVQLLPHNEHASKDANTDEQCIVIRDTVKDLLKGRDWDASSKILQTKAKDDIENIVSFGSPSRNRVNNATKRQKVEHFCKEGCGNRVSTRGVRCVSCSYAASRVVERPDIDQLGMDITSMPMVHVGEKYGVSDNAVRKWCEAYGLPTKRSELK